MCGCLTAVHDRVPCRQILREDCERNELRVREIRGEIELMQSFNHPNIVQVPTWPPHTQHH